MSEKYTLGQCLGNGNFGTVWIGENIDTSKSVILKRVYGSQLFNEDTPRDIIFLERLRGVEGIPKIIEWFKWGNDFGVVMERSYNVIDLFDFVEFYKLSESLIHYIAKQLLSILQTCFDMGIVHGDVKDENIIINTETHDIQLIDWGGGYFLKKDETPKSYYDKFGGTEKYSPPEIFNKQIYPEALTTWTFGVLLFILFCGYEPFKLLEDIPSCSFREFTDNVPLECENLIRRCFIENPLERITLAEISKHEWINSI